MFQVQTPETFVLEITVIALLSDHLLSDQPLFNGHRSKSQIYEVRVLLPPLSDQPLFNGHCPKSQIYEVRVILPHFYESQVWPLNGGTTV